MRRSSKQITPVIVLLGYLLGASSAELLHQDAFNLLLSSHPVVASHNCGAHECHIPLDRAKHCVACSPLAIRLAVLSSPYLLPMPATRMYEPLSASSFHPCTSNYYSSGKRGPPTA